MDAELLKRVARGAGFRTEVREDLGLKFIYPDDLAALARAVAEECAKVCKAEEAKVIGSVRTSASALERGLACLDCAAAIREKFKP